MTLTAPGAIAFSRTGDPLIGEFEDAVVIERFAEANDGRREDQRDGRLRGMMWSRTTASIERAIGLPLDAVLLIAGDTKTIRVTCTSRQNRYDLAGRTAAAMMGNGRVLVAFPGNYLVVAGKMLKNLIPDGDVGSWRDTRPVTLVSFERLGDARLAQIERRVILAAPVAPAAHLDHGLLRTHRPFDTFPIICRTSSNHTIWNGPLPRRGR